MTRQAVMIALMVATTACSSTNKEVAIRSVNSEAGMALQDVLARGDLLFSRGEHALALDAYRRAMRKDPADAHALNGVAISYAAMGRHDLAREFFELALARAPLDERIHRNFARSLVTQGLRAEAETLMAQLSGTPRAAAVRPTLAQLAAANRANMAAAVTPALLARAGLERVSMGEVRLRTAGSGTARPTLPGRMMSQLSTAIVSVADGGGTVPVASLSRELTAPIAKPAGQPERAGATADVMRLATQAQSARAPAVMTKAKAKLSIEGVNGCSARDRGEGTGLRLPATGYSIDLSGAKAPAKCANLAGDGKRGGAQG